MEWEASGPADADTELSAPEDMRETIINKLVKKLNDECMIGQSL